MAAFSIFQASDFDLHDDIYSQELSYLQHRLGVRSIGRTITIKGDAANRRPDRHYTLDHVDRCGGDIAGWWYREIAGSSNVLIVND